jgi:DNA mismatch repair protein MutS
MEPAAPTLSRVRRGSSANVRLHQGSQNQLSMVIDADTLRDLDVLSTSVARGQTLIDLVDRTRTRAGRQHLRRCLTMWTPSSAAIVALQRAHQLLAADSGTYRANLDRADPDGVERYLNSTWQHPDSRTTLTSFVESVWRPRWYRRYLQEVEDGQRRVLALLRAVAELGTHLSATNAVPLHQMATSIASLLATPEARDLLQRGGRQSAPALVAFDRIARGSGRSVLAEIIDLTGALEAMWSLGVATVEHRWTYPRVGSRFSVRALVHPFLGERSVSNDLTLDELVRVCFVTGPNMAGKSTFLKAVAIAVLLAQAGCGVPASSMEFATAGAIFSSVNIVDNVNAGESFYLAEVRRIAALARALHENGSGLAIVDEPFRGTNVHDAAEATLAIVTRLAAHPSALVFIASHIGEIAPSISDDRRIGLFNFAADLSGDRPRFDYQLREGVSTQRLGMVLLRQEGVLDLLDGSADSQRQPDEALHPTTAAATMTAASERER